MKKVLICGGHLTPALAVIEQLKREKIEIIFIGRKHSIEGSKNLSTEFVKIKALNIKFLPLLTGRLQRKITTHTFISIIKIPIGLLQSFIYLLLNKPNVVVSFGSYLSTPVVISAWLLGIPSITHEQATKIGIANKINSLFTREFYSAWQLQGLDSRSVIGNPTRLCIYQKSAKNKRIQQFLKTNKKILYITGGNLGSHYINRIIFESPKRLKEYKIIHQLGNANYKGDHQTAGKINDSNYFALPYIEDSDIGAVLNCAHIVVSRSGANTIWELALLKKVSLLIPLPFAGAKEQEHNAKVLEEAGSALIIHQKNLTLQTLESGLKEISANYAKYTKNAHNFSGKLKKDAATVLKNHILKYLKNA